jgi:hypothetical protein
MARSTVDNSEGEGDFARGMGIAIGMFIALFAIGIALFLIEQGKAQPAPERTGARAVSAVVPADSSTGAVSPRNTQ